MVNQKYDGAKIVPFKHSPSIPNHTHVANTTWWDNAKNHKIEDQIKLIEGHIWQHITLARKEKSAVLNMMSQVFKDVTAILNLCPHAKFAETITKTKRELLYSKLYLWSEICTSLEKIIPKITHFLEEEWWMMPDEIIINTDHIRASVLDYTKSIMEMNSLYDIVTHGDITFEKKKRYTNMPPIFKTHRPEKTPKIPELQKFLDFINLIILKIELIAKIWGEDLSEVVVLEFQ